MRRLDRLIDVVIVAAGIIAAGIGLLVAESGEGRFNALFIVVAVVLGGVTLNHTVPRRPGLVVSYRNPHAGNRPVVWQNDAGKPHARPLVTVENQGRGHAEAVEVRFAKPRCLDKERGDDTAPEYHDSVTGPGAIERRELSRAYRSVPLHTIPYHSVPLGCG